MDCVVTNVSYGGLEQDGVFHVTGIIKKLSTNDFKNLRLNNLGELEGTGHLSQGVLKLFEDSSTYDLVIKVTEAGSDKNGHTTVKKQDKKFVFTITLDDDYARNATTLALARTLIHESMHAYLGYVLQENYLSSVALSLQEYRSRQGIKLGEHEFMTQYVEAVAKSLEVWDNYRLSNSYKDYYYYLAWSGDMQNSEAFNKLPESIKSKIKYANIAEGDAVNRSSNSALGNKCN